MKYIRTANLECSVSQALYRTDFVAERCKNITLCKKCSRRFLPIVNPLSSFLTRASKNGKNLLVSFSVVNLI